jgi:hypothetical protein
MFSVSHYILTLLSAGNSLGKGTFGKVKLANHTLTGEKVFFNSLIITNNIIGGCENP